MKIVVKGSLKVCRSRPGGLRIREMVGRDIRQI